MLDRLQLSHKPAVRTVAREATDQAEEPTSSRRKKEKDHWRDSLYKAVDTKVLAAVLNPYGTFNSSARWRQGLELIDIIGYWIITSLSSSIKVKKEPAIPTPAGIRYPDTICWRDGLSTVMQLRVTWAKYTVAR